MQPGACAAEPSGKQRQGCGHEARSNRDHPVWAPGHGLAEQNGCGSKGEAELMQQAHRATGASRDEVRHAADTNAAQIFPAPAAMARTWAPLGIIGLANDRAHLTFVICGNGPYRAELEAMAAGLRNVRFFDLQPREQLGGLLGLATIHLLPQIAGAADLVLPSKLANMLASGRPVIATVAKGTGIFDEIEGCGLAVEPGDAVALGAAIERLCDDPALSRGLGEAARRRAERRWHRETILGHFACAIEAPSKSPDCAPAAESLRQ